MIENSIPIVLVLEDDVIFAEKFKEKLDSYIKQLPDDWCILSIGDACKCHISRKLEKPKPNVYHRYGGKINGEGVGVMRCTDSYLINLETAKKIYESFTKSININDPIDQWLNKRLPPHNTSLKVYWAEPTICTQGSQNKTYISSLNYKSYQEDKILLNEK